MRGATIISTIKNYIVQFQSTLPVRGATATTISVNFHCIISIHAPRAGSDNGNHRKLLYKQHFNPRSPCGERHLCDDGHIYRRVFQSTLPVRGATQIVYKIYW